MGKKRIDHLKYAFTIAYSNSPAYVWSYIIFKCGANVLKFFFDVYFMAGLLRLLTKGTDYAALLKVLLAGAAIVAVRIIFENIAQYADFMMSTKLGPIVKEDLYRTGLRYSLKDFQDKTFLDGYSMVIGNGSGYVQKSVEIVTNLICVLVYVVVLGINLVTMDRAVALVLVGALAYHYLIFSWQHRKMADVLYRNECKEQLNHRKRDYFKRIFYLKSYAYDLKDKQVYDHVMDTYDANMEELTKVREQSRRKEFKWNVLVNGYGNLYSSLIVIALIVIVMKSRGLNDIALYWQVYALFMQFYGLYFFRMGGELETLSKHVGQLKEFQENAPVKKDGCGIGESPEICVKDMDFRYGEQSEFGLQNINLTINKGEKVAIVGRNGSGKTTLFHLLLGILQPDKGSVAINGQDSKEWDITDNNVGLLCQNFNLYSVSLRENITMGDAVTDYVEMKKAADLAQCEEFLSGYEQGLETMLGKDIHENAAELSGGQGQRIALARVFYSKAKLIFMDEPTAYIDPLFEKNIVANLMESLKEKTAVVITHRLDMTRYFDRIIVMDGGRIAEEGTFAELMAGNTIFRDMYRYQVGE